MPRPETEKRMKIVTVNVLSNTQVQQRMHAFKSTLRTRLGEKLQKYNI